jgi:hypothetical protein
VGLAQLKQLFIFGREMVMALLAGKTHDVIRQLGHMLNLLLGKRAQLQPFKRGSRRTDLLGTKLVRHSWNAE